MAGFYAIEASVHRGFLDAIGPGDLGPSVTPIADQGWLGTPSLALSEIEANPSSDAVLYASDTGYRTRATDPMGVRAYPPTVIETMQIDVSVNLDPTASSVAAAWGTLKLANVDGRYNAYIAGWQSDGQAITIWRGERTIEAFDGYATARSTTATYLDQTGLIQQANAGVVRQDYTGHISIDPRTTNFLRNNTMIGAVAGTPGTAPTNWVVSVNAGLTSSIVGTGTENGIPYIDYTISGTTNASGSIAWQFETTTQVQAAVGQTWVLSAYTRLLAGTIPPAAGLALYINEYTAAAAFLTNSSAAVSPTTAALSGQRSALTRVLSSSTVGLAVPSLFMFFSAAGQMVNFTLRIGAPQMEMRALNRLVLTSGARVSIGPATTNFIRNNAMTGIAAGTPGTLPTNWTVLNASGLSQQVVGSGTVSVGGNSLAYCDLRFFGTTSSTVVVFGFESSTQITAALGAVAQQSVYAALVGGSLANITSTALDLRLSSSGVQDTAITLSATLTRFSASAPFLSGDTSIQPCLKFNTTSSAAVDFTVRICAPQLEFGSVISGEVVTTTAAASSQPTYSIIDTPTTLNEPAETQFVLSSSLPSASNVTVSTSTDVPSLISPQPVSKHHRTATGADTNTGTQTITMTGISGTPALTASVWLWLPSALPSKTAITLAIESGVSGNISGSADLSKRDQWQRISATATYVSGTVTMVLRVQAQLLNDDLYTTCWQLQTGSAATAFIPPGLSPTTLAADLLYTARGITVDPRYSSLVRVFSGVMGPWEPEIDAVSIALRDASYYLEKPLRRTYYGGTGGADGTASLAGVAKPITYGGAVSSSLYVSNFTPQSIDPANLIYDLGLGCVVNAAYDGGIPLIQDAAIGSVYFPSPPASGHYRCDANGLMQLGSTPVFGLTADGWTSVGLRTSKVQEIALIACLDVLGVPSALVSGYGSGNNFMEAYGADATATTATLAARTGFYIASGDTPTGLDIMSVILDTAGGLMVPGRDGKLRLLVLSAIPNGATPVVAFDNTNVVSIARIALPSSIDPPPWRMRLAYGRNWTVQAANQLAGGASAVQSTFAANAYRTAIGVGSVQASISTRLNDPAVIGANGGSIETTATTAQAIVNRMVALWGVQRHLYDVTVPRSVGLTLDWASIVNLTSDFDALGSPGKLGQIVGWQYSTADPTATFRVLV